MTIVANITYHICSKVTAAVNPLAALTVTYTVSLVSCLILYPLFSKQPNLIAEMKQVNWASPILGIAIVILEVGFILAFRAGWNLSHAALFSNVMVAILLVPIAIFVFRDSMTLLNGLGMILAVAGLVLMTTKAPA